MSAWAANPRPRWPPLLTFSISSVFLLWYLMSFSLYVCCKVIWLICRLISGALNSKEHPVPRTFPQNDWTNICQIQHVVSQWFNSTQEAVGNVSSERLDISMACSPRGARTGRARQPLRLKYIPDHKSLSGLNTASCIDRRDRQSGMRMFSSSWRTHKGVACCYVLLSSPWVCSKANMLPLRGNMANQR